MKKIPSPFFIGVTRACLLTLLLCVSSLSAGETAKIYYPASATASSPTAACAPASAHPIVTSIFYLIFLGALGYATYLVWRRKISPRRTTKADERILDVTTTRPLGNRQFLVVVRYKEKELLLGVGQGFITRLDSDKIEKEGASCGR
jgi:flagellar biogenesis protein FliO